MGPLPRDLHIMLIHASIYRMFSGSGTDPQHFPFGAGGPSQSLPAMLGAGPTRPTSFPSAVLSAVSATSSSSAATFAAQPPQPQQQCSSSSESPTTSSVGMHTGMEEQEAKQCAVCNDYAIWYAYCTYDDVIIGIVKCISYGKGKTIGNKGTDSL